MQEKNVKRFKEAARFLLLEGAEIQGNVNAMAAYLAHHQNENKIVFDLLKFGVCREKFQIFHKLFKIINFFNKGKLYIDKIYTVHTIQVDELNLSFLSRTKFKPKFTKVVLSNQDVLLLPIEDDLVYSVDDLFKII